MTDQDDQTDVAAEEDDETAATTPAEINEDDTTDQQDTVDLESEANYTSTDAPETDAPETDASAPETEDKIGLNDQESRDEPRDWPKVKQKRSGRRKRGFRMDKCLDRRWTCDNAPLWRIYARSFAETEERLEKEDRFKHRKPARLARFPRVLSEEALSALECLPLNAFHLKNLTELPDKVDRQKLIRIWKNMRAEAPLSESSKSEIEKEPSKTDSVKWPGVWPCVTRELMNELIERRRKRRKKRKDLFPCDPQEEDEPEFEGDQEFAERKELGHARIPPVCPELRKDLLVDRAAGERPGLVDGDYIIFELPSKTRGNRVYADVCLRGLKGMHMVELGPLRARRKTWKFCLYQAVVILLAKTQLRYKYAWGANIDYVYDHGWMLFTHIGMMNVKEKQRLDDVAVYNYKYSVELELIQESCDVPIVTDIPWDYEERNLRRKAVLERKDLLGVQLDVGSQKVTDQQRAPVHRDIRKIEEWFDKIPIKHQNCIFRTTRFSLAFWKDGLFWYLYNPYRCDEFGYWNDEGCACILKFCTRDSLRRHLMILMLRAYVYQLPKPQESTSAQNISEPAANLEKADGDERSGEDTEPTEEETCYTIQIFSMVHHCCQLHNLKLLERTAPKPRQRLVKKKVIDDCPFDPLDFRDPCTIEQEEGDIKDAIEKPVWLKLMQITWTKCAPTSQKRKTGREGEAVAKMRWHQYVVEESNKLFSLWGEIHVTDGMFEKENRGMQTYACYVVCAGMTRIMAPEYWSSKTLDVIVMCGDRYYTHSKIEAEYKSSRHEYSHVSSWSKYLTSHFRIGETMIEANVLPAICGRLYARSGKYLWHSLEQMFLKYQFGILTCEASCLGIFKFCGAYYMCDVNSFGPPIFQYGEGSVYLMRATYFYKFVTTLVLTVGSPECSQFTLNPIEILKVIDVGPASFPVGRLERKEARRRAKIDCPYDEAKKKQMKRWKHKRAETARTIDKTCCKNND